MSALPAGTASLAEAVPARFVGRSEELRAVAAAAGPVLVGGAPGVGKSRLVAEALTGVPTVIGNCRESAGPYAPLVEALGELPRATGRRELFDALLDRLGGSVVVIEDLHWAGASTRDVLSFLAGAGVPVVATYRSCDLHRRHPLRALLAELAGAPGVRRLELERLGRDEVAEQIEDMLGMPPHEELVERLWRRSGGNPLYVEELLAGPGYPLLARFERLSGPAREVARLVAVAGRPIDGVLPPACRHALLREAIYEDLLPGERTALHAAVAASAGTDAERAWHWHRARDLPRALGASVAAGVEARRAHAHGEALRHFERALGLWDRVPDAAARAGMPFAGVLRAAAVAARDGAEPARASALRRAGRTGRRE